MVLALACPVTLPLSRSLSPAPGSDTTSHSSVESVLEQEVARRSSDKHDGPSMDGLILLHHHHQGSYDSTDSGSLPPTYSRLPPDGHEFPEDYVDPSLCSSLADNQLDFLSRKSSASSTASLDRHELRSHQ